MKYEYMIHSLAVKYSQCIYHIAEKYTETNYFEMLCFGMLESKQERALSNG